MPTNLEKAQAALIVRLREALETWAIPVLCLYQRELKNADTAKVAIEEIKKLLALSTHDADKIVAGIEQKSQGCRGEK